MNHSALKKFAAKARVDLIEQVGARLQYVLNSDSVELREKASQVKQLREALKQESETALVERVAYLWFNRLAALRFMDAEGRHPFGCRVVTATEGNTQPELLQQARNGSLPDGLKLDVQRMNDLLDGRVPSSNAQAEVYRMLVVAVCNFYHQLMPFVFEKIADYTELLLPEDLLSEASVAEGFRSAVEDADCAEVELIGWLYQYYIAEKKDAVMARKKAVPKEDIPAVTQLFTPHWIVRYMVENSLGRLWMQSRPSSRLVGKMDYYIPDAEGNEPDPDQLTVSSPEEIRLIDPACGSGHILTYAFDLLYLIYEEEGYDPSSIPGHILTKNLHGVEIDERAAELAYFALMMKAQQHYGRFLRRQLRAESAERIVPGICCLEEIHFEEGELKAYMDALDIGDLFTAPVLTLMHQYEEAKNFGSLIQPAVEDVSFLREAIDGKDLGGELFLRETHRKVEVILRQADVLGRRYHCTVANPPYMRGENLNPKTKEFVEKTYKDYKANLFSMFIIRTIALTAEGGLLGLMTPISWMSLSGHKNIRHKILTESNIHSFIQPEYNAFWDSAHVAICTFTIINIQAKEGIGTYIDLAGYFGAEKQPQKVLDALQGEVCDYLYRVKNKEFLKIPGAPIAYKIKGIEHFEGRRFGDVFESGGRNKTHNNAKYLRYIWEVNSESKKWEPYANGGDFRKYAGNELEIIDWSSGARDFYDSHGGLVNRKYWNKEGITWSLITSARSGFRLKRRGQFYSSGSPTIFCNSFQCDYTALGLLNSCVTHYFLKAITPTVNTTVNDIFSLPYLDVKFSNDIVPLVAQCIDISSEDWDNFEISMGFQAFPLLKDDLRSSEVAGSWANWDIYCSANIARMKQLEEQNNRLWIDAYGLQDELTPEVPEEEITLARANSRNDMAAFISYAIGCMFGRYSLDKPGLILANAGEKIEDYIRNVNTGSEGITFMPDEDNIIPVLDGEWFEDDIVARFREFLRVTFGEDTLRENIQFIEDSLGKDLRKYFVTDFYKDHLKTYKKRPIYWLFQSPKKSFQALIYLHRYDRDTVNLLLNDYLREFQNKLQNRRKHLEEVDASESSSAKDKTAAKKEMMKIDKTLPELADWERDVILPLAQQRLEIDLDDGVKQNYPKFGKALAKIAGLS